MILSTASGFASRPLVLPGIAAVVRKIKANYPEKDNMRITVGVDGTVYKKHPTFSKLMDQKVRDLCKGSGVDVDFALSYDGSGKGAALITAVAQRVKSAQVRVAPHIRYSVFHSKTNALRVQGESIGC